MLHFVNPRAALLSGLLAFSAHATPSPSSGSRASGGFLALGDGGSLAIVAAASVRADDNILLDSRSISDAVFEFAPGTAIDFGKNASFKGSLKLTENFSRYVRHAQFNSALFAGEFQGSYDDARQKLNLSAGFHELDENNVDLPGLIRRDVFDAGIKGERELNELIALAAGIASTRTDYKSFRYAQSDDLTVPLNVFYKWTPKTALSVGYHYRRYESSRGRDSTDHFANIGARGEFTRRTRGVFNVGVTTRKLAGGGSRSTLGLSADVTHLEDFADFTFTAASYPDTSPLGEQRINRSAGVTAATNVNSRTTARVSLSYRRLDYFVRKDDYLETELGSGYQWNQNIVMACTYVWRHNYSDFTGARFGNNVLRFSAELRY